MSIEHTDIHMQDVPPEALKVTWMSLVVFRDVALEANDFQRVALYSEVIKDFANLIEATGHEIPAPPPDHRNKN